MLDRRRMANPTQLLENCSDATPQTCQQAGAGINKQAHERLLACVRDERLRRAKRARVLNLDQDFFFDPAWDILVELFHASLIQRQLSASSIGLDLGVAPSTVLRWLAILENHQVVCRRKDPNDKRRSWVMLTESALQAMENYFT